jgi:hypothetical protein
MDISGGGGGPSKRCMINDDTKIYFRRSATELTDYELNLKAAYSKEGTDETLCAFCKKYLKLDTYSTKNCERVFKGIRIYKHRANKNIAPTMGCPICCSCKKCKKRTVNINCFHEPETVWCFQNQI